MITHGDCADDAQYVADMIKKHYGVENVIINYVDPSSGRIRDRAPWRCSSSQTSASTPLLKTPAAAHRGRAQRPGVDDARTARAQFLVVRACIGYTYPHGRNSR